MDRKLIPEFTIAMVFFAICILFFFAKAIFFPASELLKLVYLLFATIGFIWLGTEELIKKRVLFRPWITFQDNTIQYSVEVLVSFGLAGFCIVNFLNEISGI